MNYGAFNSYGYGLEENYLTRWLSYLGIIALVFLYFAGYPIKYFLMVFFVKYYKIKVRGIVGILLVNMFIYNILFFNILSCAYFLGKKIWYEGKNTFPSAILRGGAAALIFAVAYFLVISIPSIIGTYFLYIVRPPT